MPSDDLNPRSGKRSIDIPWGVMVRKADKDFDREKRSEVEYRFGGGQHVKRANRATRGAYAPDPFDSIASGPDGTSIGTDDGTFLVYD